MAADDPITVLSEHEAWQLLGTARVGRLATVIDRQPDIFPVNFVVDGQSLVFRTAEGSKLLQLIVNSGVAFEVDSWHERSGWSVVVKGEAAEVTDQADLDHIDTLGLTPWVPTVKNHFIRIKAAEISARRFAFGVEPDREPDYTRE